MFFLKKPQAWINPMQIASIYREGENWTVSLSTGNTYTLEETEYVELLGKMNHKPHDKKED